MTPHPFASFIYSVQKTLGLWSGGRQSEQIRRAPFDAHKGHFQSVHDSQQGNDVLSDSNRSRDNKTEPDRNYYLPRLDLICNYLHIGSNQPSNVLINHVPVLEAIYTSLAQTTFTWEKSKEDTIEKYTRNALIPLMCADISIFKNNATQDSIYFHLNRLLLNEDIIKSNGPVVTYNKLTAKKYTVGFIETHLIECELRYNQAHKKATSIEPEILLPEIMEYLSSFSKKENQTCVTLREKIKICNQRLNNEKLHNLKINTRSIFSAYAAIIILQDINNKIGMFNHFHKTYNKLAKGKAVTLNELQENLYRALSFFENRVEGCDVNSTPSNRQEVSHITSIHKLIKKIRINIFYIFCESNEIRNKVIVDNLVFDTLTEEYLLSQMVYLPPNFYMPMKDNERLQVCRNCCREEITSKYESFLTFKKDYFTAINVLATMNGHPSKVYFHQCQLLIDVLRSIKNYDPYRALQIIDRIDHESLPSFGFIKHALAVLKIGLMYNQERKGIKNLSLMPQVNDIINHQGLIYIPTILSPHASLKNRQSWLSESDYIAHSIVAGGNTYNAVIAQAIYCYNFTIARHTILFTLHTDYIYPQTNINVSTATIVDLNHGSEMISHDLLEGLNNISKRILSNLDGINTNVEPDVFVSDLIRKGVVSSEELIVNLIHCINGSSIGVCLLDSESIKVLYSVPDDQVESFVKLGARSDVVKLLFKYYQNHTKK
ncbi:hypothetical protein [Aeromonas salmonicida]